MGDWFSQSVSHFRGRSLPEPAVPTGYSAIIERFDLALPLPPLLAGIATRHRPLPAPDWLLLTPRHQPAATLAAQLTFALKWEGVDLSVLAALFKVAAAGEVAEVVRAKPTGTFARRIWFLYEWLTGHRLNIANPGSVGLVGVVDPDQQMALSDGTASPRHKVTDNLPGTRRFCPMVRWTPSLKAAAAKKLDRQAQALVGRTRKDLVTRAAAFLLLSDSKSSFAIEGERPSSGRAARWAQAIGLAGLRALSLPELERLQRIVIGDTRFTPLGLRHEGGFVGTHDRQSQEPVPEHISARAGDLEDLIAGIIEYTQRCISGRVDPVLAAAAASFGFVYAHPFVDGNGRLHRWLLHHVLAAAAYNPPGLVFPVSAAILRRLDDYRAVLESYSAALLPFIEWSPTKGGNLAVLNDTADYYRYFDATVHADFLYSCVAQTVEHDLPDEVRFLEGFDRFAAGVKEIVEMPDRQIERLRGFLEKGQGRLTGRPREREFAALTDEEVLGVEELYESTFHVRPEGT